MKRLILITITTVFLVALTSLLAVGAFAAEEKKQDNKTLNVFDGDKKVAEIDLEKKKIKYEEGKEDKDLVFSMIAHINAVQSYHQTFMNDVLGYCKPPKKVVEKYTKKPEEKKEGPNKEEKK